MSNAGVFVGVLGPLQILKMGEPVPLRSGGKAERLISCLALHARVGMRRAALVESIWPETSLEMAGQCLNTLVHSLKTQLCDGLGGQPPIVLSQGHYALNLDSGLGVDVLEFESAVKNGHLLSLTGSTLAAISSYEYAVSLYRGDLTDSSDISGLIERERLRATCLDTLARLADAHFETADYERALESAVRVLAVDPCREDAYRMAMRAFVRLGARAQALRQYRLCRSILRDEFDAVPEPATERLYNLIRTDPDQV
jgi:DNA-binding SARP family transcriptional activator